MRNSLGFFTTFLVCLLGTTGQADITYDLLLESNENGDGGSEIFMGSFSSYNDLLSGTLSSSAFSQLNIGPSFSTGGLAFDGSQYHLLLESNDDRAAGSEVFMGSFASYNDLLDGNLVNGQFSQLNIGPSFSAGGLAFDGSQYHLLLESNDDRAAGSEVFMASFASYNDLLDGNLINGQFSQLNIGSSFSAGGLAFDGSQYQLLLESNDNRDAGSEVFMASFASYNDLLSGNLIDGQFSQLNIGPSFSAGGLVARANAVPEPSALATSLLMGLLLVRRRCRKEGKSE